MGRNGRFGFTPKQAQRVKDGIDRDIAKIEDTTTAMRNRITDIGSGTASVNRQLEELREVAHELKAIVDRRTIG